MKKTLIALLALSSVCLSAVPASATTEADSNHDNTHKTSKVTAVYVPASLQLLEVQAPSFGRFEHPGEDGSVTSKRDLMIRIADNRGSGYGWQLQYTYKFANVAEDHRQDTVFRFEKGTLLKNGQPVKNDRYEADAYMTDHATKETRTLVKHFSQKPHKTDDEALKGTIEYEYRVAAKDISFEFPGDIASGDYGGTQFVQLFDGPQIK